jgi:hypothetical protein
VFILSQIKSFGKSGAGANPIIPNIFFWRFLANINITQPPIDEPIRICFPFVSFLTKNSASIYQSEKHFSFILPDDSPWPE